MVSASPWFVDFGFVYKHASVDGAQQVAGVDVGAAALGRQPAAVEHEDAVGEADDLGQLGGPQQDDPAGVGELADEGVDLVLGADVDAPRRVVEQDDGRGHLQPLGQHDLLLVAARQRRHGGRRSGGLDAEPGDLPIGDGVGGAP